MTRYNYETDPVAETEQRCRCANDDAGPCPNYPDDDEEAPYCADCYTARVYGISRADCPHDERSL